MARSPTSLDRAPLRISPTGTPQGDGATWESAGNLKSLPAFAAAADGREIWLRADAGPYAINQYINNIELTVGGTAENPLIIRGVTESGSPGVAVFNGTRKADAHYNSTSVWLRGHDVFKIRADFITFVDMHFNRQSRIFDLFGIRSGISILNVSATHYRVFLTNMSPGNAPQGTLRGFIVSQGTHEFPDNFAVNLTGASDGVIEDLVIDGRDEKSSAPVPSCIHLKAAGEIPSRDIVVRRCKVKNIRSSTTSPDEYWNGDGFVDERGCHDIVYEECEAISMPDGGFDLKSENVRLIRCKSSLNKKNFRLWGSGVLAECESADPIRYGTGPSCHCDFPSSLEVSSVFALEDFRAYAPADNASNVLNFGSVAPVQLTIEGGNLVKPGQLDIPNGDVPASAKQVSVTKGYAEPVITWR